MKTKNFCKILLLLLLFFTGCGDLDRTNPLDPQNPDSKRGETVLVESFVNQSGGSVIESSIDAFERILIEYGAESFIYMEHHIEKTKGTDVYALDASLSRYLTLVPQTAEQAIPDVFFNGIQGRVQGASDEESAYLRYTDELEKELGRQTTFTIEAAAQLKAGKIYVTADIAKLGNTNAEEIVVNLAVTEKVSGNVRNIVRAFIPLETIGELNHGKIKTVKREVEIQPEWKTENLEIVVIVFNSRTLVVYQSERADLKYN
ncbi:hypothetical protein JXQ31_12785 [candidate division KSB1 bacterium]|nr:hypothetical protein [candidate division KSB1 bacterium]